MSQVCVAAERGSRGGERRVAAAADPMDQVATRLMARFRRTGSSSAFEELFKLTSRQLLARVRRQVRFATDWLDPHEVLQDAFVNIFRYPDRFDPSRPGAFRAWATTIVDNTVRRHLRRSRSGVDISLWPIEALNQEPDGHGRPPEQAAIDGEAWRTLAGAYYLLLVCYLAGFQRLSDRERFVLHAIEVVGMRYADLGAAIGLRGDAVKMVVFRARRRLFERMARQLQVVA